MKKLLTVKELMEILNVSRDSIYRWRKEKDLPYVVIGKGSVRFDLDEVNKWIEGQGEEV